MSDSESKNLKKTALYETHKKYGGRIVPFAGWLMPIQYSSIIDEHNAVRRKAGLFDVSHMGEIEFIGPDALKTVQNLISNDASKLEDGQAQYSGLLYEKGTFVDDILVYKIKDDHYMMVVNAANTSKDYEWIKSHVKGDVSVENISDQVVQLALQGPDSQNILQKLTETKLEELPYYWSVMGKVAGRTARISRTGYTGEHGYECYVSPEDGPEVWEAIFDAAKDGFVVKPVGLGARDTLRLEAGMPLYGNDIDDTTTPYEAKLGWIVKLKKGDFIGSEALKKQRKEGTTRRLMGVEALERGIPRPGYPLYYEGEKIGEFTSGTSSPSLKKGIGMAYVPRNLANPGLKVEMGIRKRKVAGEITALPFYNKKTNQ